MWRDKVKEDKDIIKQKIYTYLQILIMLKSL